MKIKANLLFTLVIGTVSLAHQAFADQLTVTVVRNFNFGWIEPDSPVHCTEGDETMLVKVAGETGKSFSIEPLGSPILRALESDSDGAEPANSTIAIVRMASNPAATGTLGEDGLATVEVTACRAATSEQQQIGWYSLEDFNLAFQYID